MFSQIKQNERCVTLESPRKLYDSLLLDVYGNIGEKEKNVFQFLFRNYLSMKFSSPPFFERLSLLCT